MHTMNENGFWKVCEALDCEQRVALLRYLLSFEKSEFPCVNELAEHFRLSNATMSVHLKKLATVGLVSSKRSDRRVYYRAFATTPTGEQVLTVLRDFFATYPNENRMRDFMVYVHALSHIRRHVVVRCLSATPSLDMKALAVQTDMPPQTADRLCGELDHAHIVDLNGEVVPPPGNPEATLLALTLAPN